MFCYNILMHKTEINEYINSQQSLHLYQNIRDALFDVLSKLSNEQFEQISIKLIIMAFHDGMHGQVMHFEPRADRFSVMQLYVPQKMPDDVLRWVIAHEIGHVMQGRNWRESDGMSLEDNATDFAEKIGFIKTESVIKWLSDNNT